MSAWIYASLGDSLTTDDYTGVEGGGAASLLFQNRSELWPEWDGKDLISHYPSAQHKEMAANGATLEDIRKNQVRELVAAKDRKQIQLITIAAGANEIARHLDQISPDTGWIDEARIKLITDQMGAEYARILGELRTALPKVPIIGCTLFNPNHARGKVEPWRDWPGLEPLLKEISKRFQQAMAEHEGTAIVDLYARFKAHSKGKNKKTPLLINVVEPNAQGAHVIRELWWDALATVGLRSE